MKLVVTGGRGFIGSHFVELALDLGYEIIDIDKMGYASQEKLPFDNHKNYKLIKKDISELKNLPSCDVVMNFAAESHVDISITGTSEFINTNILGNFNLIMIIRSY